MNLPMSKILLSSFLCVFSWADVSFSQQRGPYCETAGLDEQVLNRTFLNYNSVWDLDGNYLGGFAQTPWRSGWVLNSDSGRVGFIEGTSVYSSIRIHSVNTEGEREYVGRLVKRGLIGVVENAERETIGYVLNGSGCRSLVGQDLADQNVAAAGALFAFFLD